MRARLSFFFFFFFFLLQAPQGSFSDIALNIGGTEIRRSDIIRNLGVEFDACMSMSTNIASLCKCINFHLGNIARIRRLIDRATCERVICSLVTSRLDYANSLIYGINKTDLTKLQRLQNRVARLIVGASRRESALPLLNDLHWLPVRERLEFKALTHVHKCIHNSNQSQLYLHQLIHFYIPGHSGLLSNQDKTLLQQPKAKTRAGENAFTYFGPKLWNQLPVSRRSTPHCLALKLV